MIIWPNKAQTEYAPKYASIIIEAKTGRTLFARNADQPRYPASLTKIMTLYMLFEALDAGRITLDHKLKVSRYAASQAPSKLHLQPGSSISVRNAILALVTKSANDVAVVVAEGLGTTEPNFARMMTAKAKYLGLNATTFGNASGLPKGQKTTTARELAKLSMIMHKNFPQYYHYFSVKSFKYGDKVYHNHNKLLGQIAGYDGLKTGFTCISGFNLAASAQQGNYRIFAVVMGGKSGYLRDQHMKELIKNTFAQTNHIAHINLPSLQHKPFSIQHLHPKQSMSGKQQAAPNETTSNSDTQKRATLPLAKEIPNSAVQVGAFGQKKHAIEWGQTLRKRMKLPIQSKIVINASKRKKTVYQTRITNITQQQAAKICTEMKAKKQDCLVLK